jgi:FkbM family methyltransferase
MFRSNFNNLINRAVRWYLANSPVTEGKKQLLKLTRKFILPDRDQVTFNTKYNFIMTANLRNPEHERTYFYGEHDERYEIRQILKLVRKGDTCWDIGANVGFYTCLFATLVGETGKVVAFEPASVTMSYLTQNIEMNGFKNVTPIKKALGIIKDSRNLYCVSALWAEGSASLLPDADAKYSEMVEVDTIDALYQDLPVPDFVKIDVEGCQLEVLKGADAFLTKHAPLIMAELKDPNADIKAEIETYLGQHQYSIYEFDKASLKRCPSLQRSRKRNFLLVKEASPALTRTKDFISNH